jgi:hypothetical protein
LGYAMRGAGYALATFSARGAKKIFHPMKAATPRASTSKTRPHLLDEKNRRDALPSADAR